MTIHDLPNKYFINIDSQKVYKCTSVKVDEEDLYTSAVNLERLGDKKAFSFKLGVFLVKYQEMEDDDLKLIEQHKERINNTTKPIDLAWLRNPPPEEESQLGYMVTPDERDDFKNIIVSSEVEKSIELGLKKIELKDFLNNEWNLKSVEPMDGRCAINFWGPPGTGKTFSARAIARKVGKKLFIVNYSQIVSKWVGDTAKHISEVFTTAKKQDCILFFDEADSLLSRRVNMSEGVEAFATSINQNRNVLMQEIDKFNGIILFATNFFGNYDEAMLRRIAQHVEFKLPDESMREQIFDKHIPKEVTKDESINLKDCAKLTDGMSGGDIKNICVNAMVSSAMDEPRKMKQSNLLDEIKKIRSSKKKHKFTKKPLGIGVQLDEEFKE